MKCFASYLWKEGEKEIIKKHILYEAYQEVQPEKKNLNELDETSTLYMALMAALGGNTGDYINDKKTIKHT